MGRNVRVSNELNDLIKETQDSILKKTGKSIDTTKATAIIAKLTKQMIINTKPSINIFIKKKGRRKKNVLDDLEI